MKNDQRAEGTIVKALSGFYYVNREGRQFTCRARGKFRHQNITPLVGDRILFSEQPDGSGTLEEVLPRKNAFVRPAVANLDQMVIIASGAVPVTDPYLIDRMISIAERQGCEPVLCINKWDLVQAEQLYHIYDTAGFHTVKVSAKDGMGIEHLRGLLAGKNSAFTGNSGVGKSSLLNALDPDFHIQVGEVSGKLGRGRHTTRHIELFALENGGLIADTPGFSAFDTDQLERQDPRMLQDTFREFAPYIGACRFLDCAHVKETGCAVLAAVEEGKIAPSRHKSYVRLYEQAKEYKPWK